MIERGRSRQRSTRFKTREELLYADPIPATEPIPEGLLREFLDNQIVYGRDRGLLDPRELPHPESPELRGSRPPWLAETYIPRMAPRPRSRALLEALADRPLPMSVLDLPDTEVFERSYPWSTIGRVFVGTGPATEGDWRRFAHSSGTGVMVGRNLMVTASHVAPWEGDDWWMRFVPSYWGGISVPGFTQPFGGAFVEEFRGVRNEDDVTGRDIVVCRLNKPMGDLVGWMGSLYFGDEDDYYDWGYTSVGYPGIPDKGQRPIVQLFAAIDDIDDDGDGRELETHPFTSEGWSGGPLFFWDDDGPYAVGICSGTEEEFDFWSLFTKTHSVFSGGPRLVNLVRYGLDNWA